MGILVLNTGSSSLKFSLFDREAREVSVDGQVDWHGAGQPADLIVRVAGQPDRRSTCEASEPGAAASLAIEQVASAFSSGHSIDAIGHRIVHGGTRFQQSVRVDSALESELAHLAELAPLHNPPALKAIEAARAARA